MQDNYRVDKDWLGRPFTPTIGAYALYESFGKPKKKTRCKRKRMTNKERSHKK